MTNISWNQDEEFFEMKKGVNRINYLLFIEGSVMSNSVTANQPVSKAPVKAKAVSQAKPPKSPAPAPSPVKPAVKRKPVAKKVTAKVVTKPAKPAAVKKPKLVRDSFTLPQADHDLIKQCKKTAVASGRETKKSEVVRAAIQNFASLSGAAQLAAYNKLQTITLGRPKAK